MHKSRRVGNPSNNYPLIMKSCSSISSRSANNVILRRRGVAIWLVLHGRFMSATCKLFSHRRADPPENFFSHHYSTSDEGRRQVFMYLIKEDVNVRRLPDNALQMDTFSMEVLKSYGVTFDLVPLPKSSAEVKPVKEKQSWGPYSDQQSSSSTPYEKCKGKGKKGERQTNRNL